MTHAKAKKAYNTSTEHIWLSASGNDLTGIFATFGSHAWCAEPSKVPLISATHSNHVYDPPQE